ANQAAAVRGEEIDLLGRDEVGRKEKIALVFAVLVVHQHDDASGTDLGDDLRDRAQGCAFSFHGAILKEKGPWGPFFGFKLMLPAIPWSPSAWLRRARRFSRGCARPCPNAGA